MGLIPGARQLVGFGGRKTQEWVRRLPRGYLDEKPLGTLHRAAFEAVWEMGQKEHETPGLGRWRGHSSQLFRVTIRVACHLEDGD